MQYEYKMIEISILPRRLEGLSNLRITPILNRLSREGWEVMSHASDNVMYSFLLRRPGEPKIEDDPDDLESQ